MKIQNTLAPLDEPEAKLLTSSSSKGRGFGLGFAFAFPARTCGGSYGNSWGRDGVDASSSTWKERKHGIKWELRWVMQTTTACTSWHRCLGTLLLYVFVCVYGSTFEFWEFSSTTVRRMYRGSTYCVGNSHKGFIFCPNAATKVIFGFWRCSCLLCPKKTTASRLEVLYVSCRSSFVVFPMFWPSQTFDL